MYQGKHFSLTFKTCRGNGFPNHSHIIFRISDFLLDNVNYTTFFMTTWTCAIYFCWSLGRQFTIVQWTEALIHNLIILFGNKNKFPIYKYTCMNIQIYVVYMIGFCRYNYRTEKVSWISRLSYSRFWILPLLKTCGDLYSSLKHQLFFCKLSAVSLNMLTLKSYLFIFIFFFLFVSDVFIVGTISGI